MPTLSCYKVRSRIGNKAVQDFADVIDQTRADLRAEPVVEGKGFAAQLFIAPPQPHEPAWTKFLSEGYAEAAFGTVSTMGAVLVVRIGSARRPDWFAFTFGPGRYLLLEGSYERAYGLRTALNILSAGEGAGRRVRALGRKRVSGNPMRSREQSSRATSPDDFALDVRRDILREVVGVPDEAWGGRIEGRDSLVVRLDVSFDQLGDLCRRVAHMYQLDDYRQEFAWVDNLRAVTDAMERERLVERVLADLRAGNTDNYQLAAPELIEWQRVDRFRFNFDRRRHIRRMEPRLSDYLAHFSSDERGQLKVDRLRSQYLEALEGEQLVDRWSVWRCLSGEFEHADDTYVLDDGDFYEVNRDHLAEINASIARIPDYGQTLPTTRSGTLEKEYTASVAAGEGFLHVDRRLVRRTGATPVELCDLLTPDRHLIHAKRRLGSSTLSHLFAQGAVSAELLLSDIDFRRAARAVVSDLDPSNEFDFIEEAGIDPTTFEVVYAVMADWGNRTWSEALPFFSKANLVRHADDLQLRRFRISLCRVKWSG